MLITAPGKVILFGEHAVVYGCPALTAAIDSRTTLNFYRISEKNSSDFLFKIYFQNFTNEPFILSSSDLVEHIPIGKFDSEGRAYFASLSEQLLIEKNMPVSLKTSVAVILFSYSLMRQAMRIRKLKCPFELNISSTLPINAGLGSSGAYCSVIAAFFLYIGGEISDSKFSSSDLLRIQSFAHELEKFMHKSPSGVDTAISGSGGLIKFQLFENKSNIHEIDVLNRDCLPKLIVINTNTPRSTAAVVESVRVFRQSNPDIVDSVFNSIETICNEGTAVFSEYGNDSSSQLSALFSLNHRQLCRLGVSNELLDEIVQRLEALGFGAKLTGAGRGGCVIALPSKESDIVDSLQVVKNALIDLNVSVFETTLCASGIKICQDKNM